MVFGCRSIPSQAFPPSLFPPLERLFVFFVAVVVVVVVVVVVDRVGAIPC